ncbi:hypothetical protein [Thalassotalea piscium]|uniref:Uncharacterized protein n=1 Tax=Thalassotalea piscium TaxID=1230533 RepID=A0A7X0TUZ2_9GAMM|nr:hypothetical protein [Thalassotalea piscium]MBB6544590.1 hypothetical protein [Thalassotalea piscium]
MLTELLPNKGQKQLKQTEGLQNRVWDDVMQRTKPGILIYPIFWLIIAYGSGFYKSHFILTWTLEFVFILASFWRFFQFKYLEHWQTSCPTIWAAGLLISVVTHSLGWGIMFGYSTFIDNTAFSFFMGFSSSGIAAGGTNSFAPKRILATSFIITFTLPPLIAAIIAGDQWVMASLISVFIVYTLNLAKQQNREYWRSLTNEVILEKHSRTDALTSLKNRRFSTKSFMNYVNYLHVTKNTSLY